MRLIVGIAVASRGSTLSFSRIVVRASLETALLEGWSRGESGVQTKEGRGFRACRAPLAPVCLFVGLSALFGDFVLRPAVILYRCLSISSRALCLTRPYGSPISISLDLVRFPPRYLGGRADAASLISLPRYMTFTDDPAASPTYLDFFPSFTLI